MIINAIKQIKTESKEPAAVANPIGNSVAGNSIDVKYAPGMRTNIMAKILCKNYNSDFPQAQK